MKWLTHLFILMVGHVNKLINKQKRHKNFVTKDVSINDEVEIERNSRFGIIFKRLDKMILLKTVIPILTLLIVNYYCVFISRENIIDNIILQVTIFLTQELLYFFSTDKPQPLKFTLVDSIFFIFLPHDRNKYSFYYDSGPLLRIFINN